MSKTPILIVAPTRREALRALRTLGLPHIPDQPVIAIGNGGYKQLQGLITDRDHTFIMSPDRISSALQIGVFALWAKSEPARPGFERLA